MTASPSQEQPAGAEAPPRRVVRVLAALVLLAGSSLLAVLLGEVAVRLVAPQQLIILRADLWQPTDSIGHMLRPNVSTTVNTGERTVHVATDREGFRVGRAGRREAPIRVLLIGDSFAEAIQVEYEQSFAHLVEQGLSERLGREVVVRNAGVSDWSPNHYLVRTRQLLARDTFDLVLTSVFVGNDAITQRVEYFPPREPVKRHRLRVPRSLAWREVVDAVLAPTNDVLEQRSHLFVLLKNRFAGLRMRLGVTADYLPTEFRRAEARSPRWAVTAGVARAIADEARAHSLATLFVLIPERIQVYPEDFARYLRGFGIDSSLVDLDQPSRLLAASFAAESLDVIDGLAEFRAKAGGQLFGTADQHLSPDGHRLLTDLILPRAAALLDARGSTRAEARRRPQTPPE